MPETRPESDSSSQEQGKWNYLEEPLAKGVLWEHPSLHRLLGDALQGGVHQGLLLRWKQNGKLTRCALSSMHVRAGHRSTLSIN